MISHELFMLRAIELARNGAGKVSPNPMVGCVIVHDDKIIGEGWHKQFGEAHAEVNAVDSVIDKKILKNATAYVTLEPCSHHGKTPPCADLLIRHGVKKVVVSNTDPNPLVGGEGIQKLKSAGVEVETGISEAEGRELNKRFFTFINKKRPFVILKWAQTLDGFVARENFDSKWISNEYSRQLVHKWRAEEDAILVGYNTAAYDNPRLNVRDWNGNNPLRIVIDKNLKLDAGLHLFDGSQSTVCYNLLKHEQRTNLSFVKLPEENMIRRILNDLYERNIQSVIVEGGAQTIGNFLTTDLWDEARVFTSKTVFGTGIRAPRVSGTHLSSELIAEDELNVFQNPGNN